MAELAVNNKNSTTGSGLMPGAGSLMAQAKELWNSPAFRRSLPTIVAVVVTLMGLLGYFVMQQPSSRPEPDSFTPPKGAISFEMIPSLTPTIP
mgnify:CR=1 FL=1